MSGYGSGGASLSKKTLKAWTPQSLSAKTDIDYNLRTLRARAVDLAINSAIGAAAVNTFVSNVIGSGLKVFPRINAAELGLTSEQARLWRRQVKREFAIWCETCDFLRRNNFYELQSIAFQSSLETGDCFCLLKRRRPARELYSLKLQLVESNRVSNPFGGVGDLVEMALPNGHKVVNGIEVDRAGRLVAIHVSNRVSNDFDVTNEILKWQRVRIFGEETGLRNVLMIAKDTRPDMFRGVPLLAPVIESLKQVDRYADAELTSSIIKSFFSLFFTQEKTNFGVNALTGRGDDEADEQIHVEDYKLGSGTINALPPGADVRVVDSQKNQSTFNEFVTHFIKQIGAAMNLPYEVLMKNFQSSYSASRAALLQADSEFRRRKAAFVNDFCQPIYEQFLMEAVALGRIAAPDFFTDPTKRYLWSRADWYSEQSRILDPQREANAMIMRLNNGLSTYSAEVAQASGADFEDVVETLKQERELLGGIHS